MDLKDINLNKIYKLEHDALVKIAQRLKRKNNDTVDRLYYKYNKQLKELGIDFIRERIDKNTSDDKLLQHIQDAYSNLTLGGGGKLGAKELKQIETYNKDLADIEPEYYDVLYNYFLENGTDEQIKDLKFLIGSDTAFNENMFKGSRIERTNKIMKYLKDNNLLEMASNILI